VARWNFVMPAPRAVSALSARRIIAAGALAAGCAALAGPASATLYKWTDANGRVVYSDQPPPANVKTETVLGAPPPPSNPNAVKDMAAREVDFKKRQADAAEKDKKAEAQRAENAKRAEECGRAREQLRQLAAEQLALVRVNEKGEAVYVDDATRRRERDELDVWVRQNCPAT
jgi:hypothetical protein